MEKYYSVALDGPAGAGKSSIARAAAKKLNFVYVDTGAIYRTIACAVERRGISPENGAQVEALLPELQISLHWTQDGLQHMLLNGEDVTSLIRSPSISSITSKISALPAVRDFLMETQRQTARCHSVIMDGRDIGTVVLPHADVKIFLTASAAVRARRRYLELAEKGPADYEQVLSEMLKRDERDSNRAVAPLKAAEDAIIIDTSELDFDRSVDAVIRTIQRKLTV